MDRHKEIFEAARLGSTKEGMLLTNTYRTGFVAGAEWADHNISDETIKRILDLAWEYNASDIDVNNLTPEGEFEYVKTKLNN